jgi:hypothetical protein
LKKAALAEFGEATPNCLSSNHSPHQVLRSEIKRRASEYKAKS